MSIPVLIILITLVVFFIGYPFLQPKLANFLNKWYFWTFFSIAMFAYVLALYILYVWVYGINNDLGVNALPPVDSPDPLRMSSYYTIFGDATFTAFSGFLCFFLPLFLIFNPTRKIVQSLAPVGVLAGLVALSTYLTNSNFNSATMVFYDYYGSVFRHFLLAIVCYMLLFNTPKYEFQLSKTKHRNFFKTDVWFTIVIWGTYLIYIFVISNIARIWLDKGGNTDRYYYNCSGLYKQDYYEHGQYNQFHAMGITYPLPPILLWSLIFGSIFGVNFLWNCIKKLPRYDYKHPDHFYLSKKTASPSKWWHW